MNVGEVLDTVEQGLLSKQLSSLERLILCQSWLGRGYSEMAYDCGYSIAHIKEIGSRLWQALSKAIGEKVTKKNLFLVFKQYLLSRTGETVVSDQLSVTLELVEAIDPPLTPITNQLPDATDLIEASYSEDSEQLPLACDRCELVTQEDEWLPRVQQEYQTSTENTEVKDNKDAPVTQSEPTIPSDRLPLDSPLYINRPPICIKTPRLEGKSFLLSRILTRAPANGYKTLYLDFQEADVTVCAGLDQFLRWLCANLNRQLNLNPMLGDRLVIN